MTQRILSIIARSTNNDKIAKGNINKLREHYQQNYNDFASEEVSLLSRICFNAERQLDRKAASRPSLSECAIRTINFDPSKIAGCVEYTHIIIND